MLEELLISTKLPLSRVEKKVARARLTGLSFCQLDELSRKVALDNIIIQGSMMYGISLPDSDFVAERLSVAIEALILHCGYEELTEKEILFALLLNTNHNLEPVAGLEEYHRTAFNGMRFSVEFLSDILKEYFYIRQHLNRRIIKTLGGGAR